MVVRLGQFASWTVLRSFSFMDVFERILHVDQLSYAVQWLTGPSSTPTPITRFVCCTISVTYFPLFTYYCFSTTRTVSLISAPIFVHGSTSSASKEQLHGTRTKPVCRFWELSQESHFWRIRKDYWDWKNPFTISIRSASMNQYGKNRFQQMLATWRDSNKGIFSMFSADTAPPPLIAPAYYTVSPWATYLLLLVESNAYPTFYQAVYENLAKKDKNTLESAVKVCHPSFEFIKHLQKAASKVSMNIPLTSLAPYCWANFVTSCRESPVYPLAVQQLATEVYRIRTVNGLVLFRMLMIS